jgi:DNA-binding SARP family transcriptional activator
MRLVLFGAPAIDGTALPFERRSQLLAFLALKRGWVGRAELAALLWPELDPKLAFTNLRKTLFRLSSASWAPALASEGGALRLDIDTDVAQFEAAVRGDRVGEALALRTAELLQGFDDDANNAWSAWLSFERERLRTLWRDAALARLGGDVDASEGIDLSARLLEADPLDEAALTAQMTWLARSGQGARARLIAISRRACNASSASPRPPLWRRRRRRSPRRSPRRPRKRRWTTASSAAPSNCGA